MSTGYFPDPLLIVADDYRMAVNYAREHDLGPEGRHRWLFVTEPQQVTGRQGGRYIVLSSLVGNRRAGWLHRRNKVLAALRMAGFTEL